MPGFKVKKDTSKWKKSTLLFYFLFPRIAVCFVGGREIFPSRVNVCFRLGFPDKDLSEVITGSPSRRVEIETE